MLIQTLREYKCLSFYIDLYISRVKFMSSHIQSTILFLAIKNLLTYSIKCFNWKFYRQNLNITPLSLNIFKKSKYI